MRSLLIPPFLILLTGATAPAGCIFDVSKADTGGEPDEIATFGRACQPEVPIVVDLPDDAAYILSVEGVTIGDGEDILTPLATWSQTADALTVTCPAGTSSFIATYATTEIL